jgi:hypothetical protein
VAALKEPLDRAGEDARAAWLSGPYAQRIRAIEAFALQRAEARDTQMALETLQVLSSVALIVACNLFGVVFSLQLRSG